LLIDRVELGVLSVEKQYGKYWVTYEVKYPEEIQKVVEQAHKDYRSKRLVVNVSELQSKVEYILHIRQKKIKRYKLHLERDGMDD
jgi:hypothetical protein